MPIHCITDLVQHKKYLCLLLMELGAHEFACVQLHNTLMGRGDIVKETTLEIFNTKDKKYWNAVPVVSLNHEETGCFS